MENMQTMKAVEQQERVGQQGAGAGSGSGSGGSGGNCSESANAGHTWVKIHGQESCYFKSGQLEYDGEYKNGKRHGQGKSYYLVDTLSALKEFCERLEWTEVNTEVDTYGGNGYVSVKNSKRVVVSMSGHDIQAVRGNFLQDLKRLYEYSHAAQESLESMKMWAPSGAIKFVIENNQTEEHCHLQCQEANHRLQICENYLGGNYLGGTGHLETDLQCLASKLRDHGCPYEALLRFVSESEKGFYFTSHQMKLKNPFYDSISLLIKCGCDLNAFVMGSRCALLGETCPKYTSTLLIGACYSGDWPMVVCMLENGVDPNLCCSDGYSPLMEAAYMAFSVKDARHVQNHLDIAALLVREGADINYALTDMYSERTDMYDTTLSSIVHHKECNCSRCNDTDPARGMQLLVWLLVSEGSSALRSQGCKQMFPMLSPSFWKVAALFDALQPQTKDGSQMKITTVVIEEEVAKEKVAKEKEGDAFLEYVGSLRSGFSEPVIWSEEVAEAWRGLRRSLLGGGLARLGEASPAS
jgi:hypothetical protein